MEFLHREHARACSTATSQDGQYISAKDKDVIVIGGGDTGTDCVGTSLRHGCQSVVQFEILPRPPAERAAGQPLAAVAQGLPLDYGQEEAAALFGADPRTFCVTTKRFVGDDGGHVKAIADGRGRVGDGERPHDDPRESPAATKIWPAELVLLAMGFLGPGADGLLEELGVALDARGNVAADERKMTSVPGVFAAGDMRRGQSLVVWAIAEGRHAAGESTPTCARGRSTRA